MKPVKMNMRYDENGLALTINLTPEQLQELGWNAGDNILPSLTADKDIRLVNQHYNIRTTSQQLREAREAMDAIEAPELAGTTGFKKS